MFRVIRRKTRGNFPADESRSKLSQMSKTNEKNCSTSKEHLDYTNYIRPSIPRTALNVFSPGNPVVFLMATLLQMFVQPVEKFLEQST